MRANRIGPNPESVAMPVASFGSHVHLLDHHIGMCQVRLREVMRMKPGEEFMARGLEIIRF